MNTNLHMFYITVSNGLLKDGHRKRMGSAIWEFMWCLDKITKIDSKGDGYVLGGKPVKLEEFGFDVDVDTIGANLAKLEEAGYIKRTRTPYGTVIKVMRAKKRFNQKPNSFGSDREKLVSPREKLVSNKTVSIDNTVDSIAPASPPPFSYQEYLKKMQEDKRPSIRFIAFYLKKRKLVFDSEEQVKVAIKRHIRAATDVVKFGEPAVNAAVKVCELMESEKDIKWTIETVLKVLTK